MPSRGPSRLVIGTAIPLEAGTFSGGAAAVRKGSEARMKPREKYIPSSTLKRLLEHASCLESDYEPCEVSGTGITPRVFIYLEDMALSQEDCHSAAHVVRGMQG